MKRPVTAEEVVQEILLSFEKSADVGDQRFRQLAHVLSSLPGDMVLEGVIRIFETAEGSFPLQELTGRLLETVTPKTELDPATFLKRVLKSWDKSVEQLPYWFLANYGADRMQEVFARLQEANLTDREKNNLQTMLWWLNGRTHLDKF